jgi:hypothetical protein
MLHFAAVRVIVWPSSGPPHTRNARGASGVPSIDSTDITLVLVRVLREVDAGEKSASP